MAAGIIIIDKPRDWTSQDVAARLRRVFATKRIGHGGTLDPMATGVLPIFVGRATRAVEFFEQAQKEYIIQHTGALCAEMEGAAISHAAWRNQIPVVVIRAISDKADASSEMDYPTFEAMAAKRCAQVVLNVAKTLAESD